MKATAQIRRTASHRRASCGRRWPSASGRSAGASKERDVTAALAVLLETPAAPEATVSFASAPDAEAVPQPIGGAGRRLSGRRRTPRSRCARWRSSSVGADPQAGRAPAAARAGRAARAGAAEAVAGQFAARADAARRGAQPPPVSIFAAPAAAAGAAVRGWRTTSQARSPEVERSTRERAVALFDCGLELRRGGRYGEALDAWEKALALAPDNRIYQANVQRLRMELGRLRAETPPIDVASALRIARPTLGPEAGVGLYRLLRLVAFDAMTGAEAVATARAAGEKVGRSLGRASSTTSSRCARPSSWRRRGVGPDGVERTRRGARMHRLRGRPSRRRGDVPLRERAGGGRGRAIFRRPVRVRETACQGGCGDDACRFDVDFT